ncbi:rhomboid-related protein 4 isoform 4-T5 [Salvelinus alpinus]|uniref:rhomboid-related protein 4 isoform X3 n=1 Tax=Salvelinus sp. IW2-2015 TaxID=2691554 RepID=UPI000CEB22E4|nr:rhomboid-related protein 4 isoform X3 [Salvelinus alpinus]
MRNRQRGGGQLGLILLASQVFQVGVENIPPVTLAVLGLNVYLFLVPNVPLLQACISVQQAYWRGDWRRLVLSPLHHLDDYHLYFNMASFLWKGVKLEPRLGSSFYAWLLAVFSLLTGVIYLLLEMVLSEITQDPSYSIQCAVGFSGVLFALKVLSNHYHPGGVSYVMGVPVANRYASWVELVLIHLTSPGTSFVGHLAGILVGLLYTAGPLKIIMRTIAGGSTQRRPTSYGFNIPGELTAEEIRRRRLQRIDHFD